MCDKNNIDELSQIVLFQMKKHFFLTNILDILAKLIPLCSPPSLPLKEPNSISLQPLFAVLANSTILLIPSAYVHCHKCVSDEEYLKIHILTLEIMVLTKWIRLDYGRVNNENGGVSFVDM